MLLRVIVLVICVAVGVYRGIQRDKRRQERREKLNAIVAELEKEAEAAEKEERKGEPPNDSLIQKALPTPAPMLSEDSPTVPKPTDPPGAENLKAMVDAADSRNPHFNNLDGTITLALGNNN